MSRTDAVSPVIADANNYLLPLWLVILGVSVIRYSREV